ncbi:MAG: glycosyltransferase [Chitinophagaceae bacterium]
MDATPRNIVWIAQWYPHEGEPYAGDFIQRHAQAVSLFLPITVYACFGYDGDNKTTSHTNGNLTEHIDYFKKPDTGIAKLDKIIYWRRWYRILQQHLKQHRQEKGKPNLLHCHIILNAGWLGLWAKRNWNIPFIVTEHWAGYMPGAINGYDAYNSWSKRKFHTIVRQASIVTGVSLALVEELQALEPRGRFLRWPNVVNGKIFFCQSPPEAPPRPVFMHVSTLTGQKNPGGILRAVALVKSIHPAVLLKIVGPPNRDYQLMSVELGISGNIEWLGEMPQDQLAAHFDIAAALVLFSKFESFGCVVIEANATGLPVIVSDIAPLLELVTHQENGLVVEEGNVASLAAALASIIEQQLRLDRNAIANATLSQYAYEVVGKQMADIYHHILDVQTGGG